MGAKVQRKGLTWGITSKDPEPDETTPSGVGLLSRAARPGAEAVCRRAAQTGNGSECQALGSEFDQTSIY